MTDDRPYELAFGNGAEPHQHVPEDAPHDCAGHLTTDQGMRVGDGQNSLKAGASGPTLLEDFVLREKIFHFDHERIPERIVHARGSGAHGFFELYESLEDLTMADLFGRPGEKTPVFVRFSTVAGGAGSVDTPRDVRGFAVKFYTRAGNFDLVGNNIPVFFIQDAIKFPDLIHAVKMEADRAFPQAASAHDTFWDFVSLMPESTHMLMWAMSDRTLPRSLRTMEGFGVHTFRMVAADGRSSFVKFHWKPKAGVHSTVWDEALALQSADNDFHRRDLWEAIEAGDFPEWELGLQVFDQAFADELPFDVLDPTKLIPEEICPVRRVGRLVLDRNPDNFFAETEQVAFCPANIVPGIDFSDDPLLQGRLFSYLDTQKSRLGTTNFHRIPINAPKCPVANFHRDGMMQTVVPMGRATYEPNSLADHGEDGGPRECPATGFFTHPSRLDDRPEGTKLRVRPERFADHLSQARLFWRSQTPSERAHIASAFVFELSKVKLAAVAARMVARLRAVDEDLGRRVADGLGIDLPRKATDGPEPVAMDASPALSIQMGPPPTLAGRRVGLLVDDGSDGAVVKSLMRAVEKAGGRVFVVAPRIGGARLDDDTPLPADGQLAGSPSALFDAVAVVLTAEAAMRLSADSAALRWVMDAFAHLKTIGRVESATPLLEAAGIADFGDDGVVPLDARFTTVAPRRHWDREPTLRRLA